MAVNIGSTTQIRCGWCRPRPLKNLQIGKARTQGSEVVVPVAYGSPSIVSATRPGASYQCDWVVGEESGHPVLKDVRYGKKGKASISIVQELSKIKADYDKKMGK